MKRVVDACFMAVVLAVLVAFVVSPMPVQALNYNVGVKIGDWIKYGQFTVSWTGIGTEPSSVTDERNVDWVMLEVTSVSGTMVTFNVSKHYVDGKLTYNQESADVNVSADLSSKLLFAANLRSGDQISPQSGEFTINYTTSGVYAGASRTVNLLDYTSVKNNLTTSVKTYFDQSTGLTVESIIGQPDSADPATARGYIQVSMKATETNIWSQGGPSLMVGFSVICMVLAVISFYGLRRINRVKDSNKPT